MINGKFHRILVANRGEIAMRIIRAIREMGKVAIVIHSDYDSDMPFVRNADEAYSLGAGSLSETYLNISRIIKIAGEAHADAIHPGYGFLAENPEFARKCSAKGIKFIGPTSEVIELMGHKSHARETARTFRVPVLDGFTGEPEDLISREEYPFPVLVKPSAGGGGKGMRIVSSLSGLKDAVKDASREALNYFGSGELYIEKYLEAPRHIEVQVIADSFGNAVHLFERECSVQRRYQKIIEESPSGFITAETREKITDSALRLVRGINYINAGTIEFLVDENQDFYFLEMNTRIQVEHPVTEMVTGIDLVKEQINIAEGMPLSVKQEDIRISGHAIEVRIYAEDPENDFLPSAGRIATMTEPENRWIRIDTGYATGNLVEPYYDPMIAKIIVTGISRDDARSHMIRSLKDFRIAGLTTNRDFLIELLKSADFAENRVHTKYVDCSLEKIISANRSSRSSWSVETVLAVSSLISLQSAFQGDKSVLSPWHHIGHWRILPEIVLLYDHTQYRIRYELLKGREKLRLFIGENIYDVSLENQKQNYYWIRVNNQLLMVWGIIDRSDILIDLDGHFFKMRRLDFLDKRYLTSGKGYGDHDNIKEITAPLHGRIVQINSREGGNVSKGDALLIIESMKMENKILATRDSVIEKIHVAVGDQVEINKLLISLAK